MVRRRRPRGQSKIRDQARGGTIAHAGGNRKYSRGVLDTFGSSIHVIRQNDQFVQEALDRENAFELFMRIMNDPQCPARFLPFSCTMYELLSGLTARTSRHQLCKLRRH
jgi:hypothetical protein